MFFFFTGLSYFYVITPSLYLLLTDLRKISNVIICYKLMLIKYLLKHVIGISEMALLFSDALFSSYIFLEFQICYHIVYIMPRKENL